MSWSPLPRGVPVEGPDSRFLLGIEGFGPVPYTGGWGDTGRSLKEDPGGADKTQSTFRAPVRTQRGDDLEPNLLSPPKLSHGIYFYRPAGIWLICFFALSAARSVIQADRESVSQPVSQSVADFN